jgi:hypothetical protein
MKGVGKLCLGQVWFKSIKFLKIEMVPYFFVDRDRVRDPRSVHDGIDVLSD